MSLTKESANSDLSLNFEETLFSLPQGQRPTAAPAADSSAFFRPDQKPEFAATAPANGIFAEQSFAVDGQTSTMSAIQSATAAVHSASAAVQSAVLSAAASGPAKTISPQTEQPAVPQSFVPPPPPIPQQTANWAPETSMLFTPQQQPVGGNSTPEQLSRVDNEFQLLKELQRVNNLRNEEVPPSKDEIANMLEGFAHFLRNGNDDVFANVKYKDFTAEIMQLKELLLEAQETIISLLNDRVFDRAKIAKLESEARLLPDLQAQATRAMGLAMRSEEVQKEISQVRAEVERLRTSYVRSEQQQSQGFLAWLFGRNKNP